MFFTNFSHFFLQINNVSGLNYPPPPLPPQTAINELNQIVHTLNEIVGDKTKIFPIISDLQGSFNLCLLIKVRGTGRGR